MTLLQAYLEWEQETERRGMQQGIEQGIEQGTQQGQRQVVENLLKARFGELDEQLTAIIAPMLELPPPEYASVLLHLPSVEREELLSRFEIEPQS